VLIDCLGTWLTRLMDGWQAWDDDAPEWASRLETAVSGLAAAVAGHPSDVVVVTNEVGWGLVSEYRSGRLFADNLGRINQRVAASCDRVVLLVAGRPIVLPSAL
jgi:adenosylcobinamide kinase/adenosylcobinamide-phosphate guanylyltransferase